MTGQVENVTSAMDFWSKVVQPRMAHIRRTSFYDGSEDVSLARRTIDDELAAMRLAMCALRTHRNTLAPISGLPLEIITRILQLHASDEPPSKRDLGWIEVTHVCRAWRDAVNFQPAMWNRVTAALGPRWLELMLHRAKSAPLSCELNRGQDSEHFAAQILPHLSHLRHLTVFQTHDAINVITRAFKSSAPMLSALEFTGVYNQRHHAVLPDRIFDSSTPMLRRVRLNNVSMPWSASILRDLTYLHIALGMRPVRRPSGSESDFLRALERMPALMTLYLENALPAGHPGQSGDGRTVQLARLRTLTIKDEGPRCLSILKWLGIPPSCRLDFNYEYCDESALDGSLPLLRDKFPAEADSFHTLSIGIGRRKSFGLELWRESSVHDLTTLNPPRDPDLFIGASCLDTGLTKIIRVLCDVLPLDNVRTILIRDHKHSGYDWRSLFADNCQSVENVFIEQVSEALNFCKTLGSLWALGDDMGFIPGHPFFPKLKLLMFQSVNLRDGAHWDISGLGQEHLLTDTLDKCRARGRPISMVRLEKGCIIDTAKLNVLRDIVHVELDPDVVQDAPKAPARQDSGFVYSSRQHLPLS